MTLFAWLRCEHSQLSRLFTIGERTYQTCLECGAELEYDLETMQPTGQQVRQPIVHPDSVQIARGERKMRGARRSQAVPERSTSR